jgi:uncharacterized membrane protein
MAEDVKVIYRGNGGTIIGPVWVIGWLFTVGYLKLAFWKGVLALIVWPYDLGVFFRK